MALLYLIVALMIMGAGLVTLVMKLRFRDKWTGEQIGFVIMSITVGSAVLWAFWSMTTTKGILAP